MHARGLQPPRVESKTCIITILIHACARIATAYAAPRPSFAVILIHACARIATQSLWDFHSEFLVLIHACAKIATTGRCNVNAAFTVLIHVCAKIATRIDGQHHDTRTFWFIHARGLQRRPGSGRSGRRFDSCMRENCNGNNFCCWQTYWDFDSCMCEDCNCWWTIPSSKWPVHFNLCMYEDCNTVSEVATNIPIILIHACARIATPDLCYRKIAIFILIHACARIATHKSPKEQTEYDILIHACARIATARGSCYRA